MIKTCETCESEFDAKRKNARFCCVRCYRKSPAAVAWQKDYDASPPKLKYWYSEPGRLAWRRNASKKQILVALERMGATPQSTEVNGLYLELREAVGENEAWAREILKGGHPDAREGYVEFKFGVDFLRSDQLISDILDGCRSRVRWLPSYDALEKILQGGPNDSSLFDSYQSYIIWCQEAKKF
jgi:hypothetical protein